MEFTRIKNDVNGNPRYVVHFLNLLTEKEKEFKPGGYKSDYAVAVKRANKIGGRKYHAKAYGGGIVFQSYCIRQLEQDIIDLVKKESGS
jgi:hypothetical protein